MVESSAKNDPLIRAWAGFTEGHIDLELHPESASGTNYGALYKTRKDASRFYDDVRRVVIYEDTP